LPSQQISSCWSSCQWYLAEPSPFNFSRSTLHSCKTLYLCLSRLPQTWKFSVSVLYLAPFDSLQISPVTSVVVLVARRVTGTAVTCTADWVPLMWIRLGLWHLWPPHSEPPHY
jgi:hypothetical protein